MKQQFSVSGMDCENCKAHVEKAVRDLAGILDVEVSLETNSMIVDFDEKIVDIQGIISAVEEEDYGAEAVN